MKILTKTLLALALTGFAMGYLFVTGVITPGGIVSFYMTLPLGAVFFGLFLISLMLEKEAELFDLEQAAHPANARPTASRRSAVAGSPSGYSVRPAH